MRFRLIPGARRDGIAFPYQMTPDQESALADIKLDGGSQADGPPALRRRWLW